ncbi:MAG TPA: SCO family protein [Candidatus Angelobacter sp.]|nr:SCO family protein [Candidatus Angelobacter sp.]
MADIKRRTLLAGIAAGSVIAYLSPGGPSANSTPHHAYQWQDIPPREMIRRRHLPNLQLITHEGKKVRFYDDLIKDHKVIVNFMFTACKKACPLVTANLVRVQRMLSDRIGHDIYMYSITLDPEVDTPKRLREYAAMHRVGAGWLFLTGKSADIELLRRSLGFVQRNPLRDADKTNHIGVIRFGTEASMRWAACPGLAPADWIAISILSEMDSPLKGGVNGNT